MSDNQLDKVPPQSMDAEMSLLGSLLIDKEAILKVADIVSPEDFYKTGHGRIFETIEFSISLNTSNSYQDLPSKLKWI